MTDQAKKYLSDILHALELIEKFTVDITDFNDYLSDLKTQSAAYPFFEGQIGFNTASNGTSRSGILWSLNAGAKVQIGSKGLARIGLFYEQRTLNTSNNEGGRNGIDTWGLNVGFAVFFGS